MSVNVKKILCAVGLLALSGLSQAAVLFERAPSASLGGVQADASTGSYSQSFGSLAGATLDSITWWGFHFDAPAGGNAFTVALGGNILTGVMSSTDVGNAQELYRYTLDITDVVLTGSDTTLEIVNDSFDVQWAWQDAVGGATAGLTAFRLEGTRAGQPVPEPGVLGLLGLALVAGAIARKRIR